MTRMDDAVRLMIYLGEEKRHGDRPLYHAIVARARALKLAGATVLHGTEGFGQSTRLHTAEVLFSEDLPVVIVIIDTADKIDPFVAELTETRDIALVTREKITGYRAANAATLP